MEAVNQARLKGLEKSKSSGNGVAIVEPAGDGYRLPNGEIVRSLDRLYKRYSIVIIDDM